ncbi:sphingomyelin phosphodiesterase 3-like isoform X1 [Branchiostoma lanceolatum]|uniref:sphingomyelin phosphodiesterase 3-like isoform X1 n=1 Tax=Branchiostoma lanceolatum TaxID=7740 RepID=UPI0034511504
MVLHTSEFDSPFLGRLHTGAWALIFPCYWSINHLASLFIATDDELANREEDPCYEHFLQLSFLVPFYLALSLLTAPLALLGFVVWAPLQGRRHPYVYSCSPDTGRHFVPWKHPRVGRSFIVATANLCLLPECAARYNNLRRTQWRAREIGHRVASSQTSPKINIVVESPSEEQSDSGVGVRRDVDSFDSRVSSLPSASQSGNVHAVQLHAEPSCSRHEPNVQGSTNSQGSSVPNAHGSNVAFSLCSDSRRPAPVMCNGFIPGAHAGNKMIHIKRLPALDGASPPPLSDSAAPPAPQDQSDTSTEGTLSPVSPSSTLEYMTACSSLYHTACSTLDSGIAVMDGRHDAPPPPRPGVAHDVAVVFPYQLDFLCLQEVFDKRAGDRLARQLHRWFGYVVRDVGNHSLARNCFVLNSGLLFASRYPILDVAFKHFPEKAKEEYLACKGLLMAKVLLGTTKEQQRIVGYVANTHLQATEGDDQVRLQQLGHIPTWLEEFRQDTWQSNDPPDLVMFDLLCGDFNFNNLRSDHRDLWSHPLFDLYTDPCRTAPGEDKPWTVGTLLKQENMHYKEVNYPEGLERILRDDTMRGLYVYDDETDVGTAAADMAGKHRIDYTMYREGSLSNNCVLQPEEVWFVAQLASLTDHVPFSFKFSSRLDDFQGLVSYESAL